MKERKWEIIYYFLFCVFRIKSKCKREEMGNLYATYQSSSDSIQFVVKV